jgi:hypothetical protein
MLYALVMRKSTSQSTTCRNNISLKLDAYWCTYVLGKDKGSENR